MRADVRIGMEEVNAMQQQVAQERNEMTAQFQAMLESPEYQQF